MGVPLGEPQDPYRGRKLGNYRVLAKLVTGERSEILLARQEGVGGFSKYVVMKLFLPHVRQNPELLLALLAEARAHATLSHPNLAQIYDLDTGGTSEPFISMEFVQGVTLAELFGVCAAKGLTLPLGVALSALRDSALALHHAHSHVPLGKSQAYALQRNLSPSKIMVTYDGMTKVTGFSSQSGSPSGRLSTPGGTELSPEQRGDLASLGTVLQGCLLRARRQGVEVPETLDALAARTQPTSKTPFQSARELARTLETASAGMTAMPEDVAAFMQGLFADRQRHTRELLSNANLDERTGFNKVAALLGLSQAAPAKPRPPPGPGEADSPNTQRDTPIPGFPQRDENPTAKIPGKKPG